MERRRGPATGAGPAIGERVVTIGGGTGSFTMLSALRRHVANLSAVVAMTDSGGSSRRLMDEFGRPLPVGDLRQALVALSRSRTLWGSLFGYRFPGTEDGSVGGHALGNLILHALEDLNGGDLLGALEDAEELLDAAGRVLPVTLERATLVADLADGTEVRGESAIDRPGDRSLAPIAAVRLEPRVTALRGAVKALERADTIVVGPGDLFTSVAPCLLVDGVPEAIRAGDARVVYVCNVMTKRGETDGFAAPDFLRWIHRFLGRRVDAVVVNTGPLPADLVARYAEEGAEPVRPDLDELAGMAPRLLAGEFALQERMVRHDAERVALALWPGLAP